MSGSICRSENILKNTIVQAFWEKESRHLWRRQRGVYLRAVPRGPSSPAEDQQHLLQLPCRESCLQGFLLWMIISANLSNVNCPTLKRLFAGQLFSLAKWVGLLDGPQDEVTPGHSVGGAEAQGASGWKKQRALDQAGRNEITCAENLHEMWTGSSKVLVSLCH